MSDLSELTNLTEAQRVRILEILDIVNKLPLTTQEERMSTAKFMIDNEFSTNPADEYKDEQKGDAADEPNAADEPDAADEQKGDAADEPDEPGDAGDAENFGGHSLILT